MNLKYEQTLYKNFNKALELCSQSYTNSDLINMLKTGNIPEKQFAALEISELNSQENAKVFLSNLINCDGKIREAVAQKFSEFVLTDKYRKYFYKYPEIFSKSTIDINANISRMVIDGLEYMCKDEEFGSAYAYNLTKYIYEAFDGLDKIIYKDKKYTINKQMFKLYWCLEGLKNYYQYIDEDELLKILSRSSKESEYTVREKSAQILALQTSKKFDSLKQLVKSDENYYVRKLINQCES